MSVSLEPREDSATVPAIKRNTNQIRDVSSYMYQWRKQGLAIGRSPSPRFLNEISNFFSKSPPLEKILDTPLSYTRQCTGTVFTLNFGLLSQDSRALFLVRTIPTASRARTRVESKPIMVSQSTSTWSAASGPAKAQRRISSTSSSLQERREFMIGRPSW